MPTQEQLQKALQAGYTPQQIKLAVARAGQTQPQKKTLGGFARNVVGSGANAVGGIASSIVNIANPNMEKNTVANLGKLGLGVAQLAIPGEQGQEGRARAVGDFYKQRYGGWDNIGNTLYNDPVGAALDVSAVAGGAGAALKGAGAASKVSGLTRAGNTLSRLGSTIDPLQAVGRGVGSVTRPVGNAVKNVARGTNVVDNTADIMRLRKIAAKEGVSLPLSATTNNQFVRQGETMTAKGLFGKGVSDRFNAASNMPDEMLRRVTEPNIGDTSAIKNSLGQSVRSNLKSFSKGFKDTAGEIYDQVDSTLGDAPVTPTKTQQVISNLYDQQRQSAVPQGAAQQLLESIYYNLENTDTYSKLNQTRKDLGQLMKSSDPVATGQQAQLKAIYSAIQNDLDTVVNTSPEARTAYIAKQGMDAKWNEFRTLLNKQEGKNILGDITDIEDIVPRIYRPNNVSSIKRLKQFVLPQTFKELGDTLLTDMVNSTVGNDGLISPRRWQAMIKRWDKPTLTEALGAGGVRKLEEISKVVDDAQFAKTQIGSATKAFNGSQTAMLANTGIGAGSLTGSILTLNPVPILSYLGANALGAGVFGTQAGRNMLSGSAKMPSFAPATRSMNTLLNAGKAGRMINDSANRDSSGSMQTQPNQSVSKKTTYKPSITQANKSQRFAEFKYKKPKNVFSNKSAFGKRFALRSGSFN